MHGTQPSFKPCTKLPHHSILTTLRKSTIEFYSVLVIISQQISQQHKLYTQDSWLNYRLRCEPKWTQTWGGNHNTLQETNTIWDLSILFENTELLSRIIEVSTIRNSDYSLKRWTFILICVELITFGADLVMEWIYVIQFTMKVEEGLGIKVFRLHVVLLFPHLAARNKKMFLLLFRPWTGLTF